MHPRTCDPRQLDLFLRNRLGLSHQQEVEAHLLACAACRNKLDELAGGACWWSEVRQYLGGDGATELVAGVDGVRGRRGVGIVLDFLSPSQYPASLGRLGQYEVLEVLGQGGMGIVLKAFDPALHRPVAIKVLAAQYAAHGAARKRFAREARAVAAVIHDHVVPVYGVDADATPPYLVMALIAGQSLEQRIDKTGPLEVKEVLRIGMQTAAGLAAAHAQGLVHRDIKPANIMLENGVERVRITDFGLARAVDDASVTQRGAVAGTPQYMAPEQAQGESVDQRADLFALGSTMYAMCTGRAPFRGDSGMAVIRQVCDVDPPSIRSINPDVPIWLEGIIRKLHAKVPAERFQSAADVAELLERCLAHVQQPEQHPLPWLAEEPVKPATSLASPRLRRRWPPVAAALGIAALIGAALLLGPKLSLQPTELDPEPARILEPSTAPGLTEAEVLAADVDRFENEASEVRSKLDRLKRSVESLGDVATSLEPALDRARHSAESLRRELSEGTTSSINPVDAGLESLRRRIERLRESDSE
jgi:serine/threonine-protein kinase